MKYGGLRYLEAAHVKDFIALLRLADNGARRVAWFRVLQLRRGRRAGAARAARCGERPGRRDDVAAGRRSRRRSSTSADALPAARARRCRRAHALGADAVDRGAAAPRSLAPSRARRGLREALAPLRQGPLRRRRAARRGRRPAREAAQQASDSIVHFVAELVLEPPSSSADLAQPPHLDEDYLVLSTIHSAKGLEWDSVHVLAVYDGHFPAYMA